MHFQSQLIYKLTFGTFLMLWAHSTAEVLTDEASLNNLYNNLLQREYAGPVVFPNHQVERKAQRSPSLRLRFGRRSDPDLLPQNLQKRWFGEVNQKPIRSPSLRLRFGRRSDPSMPMHSAYDILMNGQQTLENNEDYNDVDDAYYNRVVRKPQRLRFGRSLTYPSPLNTATNDNDVPPRLRWGRTSLNTDTDDNDVPPRLRWGRTSLNTDTDDNDVPPRLRWGRTSLNTATDDNDVPPRLRWGRTSLNTATNDNDLLESGDELNDVAMSNSEDDFYKLRNLFKSLNSRDNDDMEEESMDVFERAIRKPGPLRLRWGRSTGTRSSVLDKELKVKNEGEQKNKVAEVVNDVADKSVNQQNKD